MPIGGQSSSIGAMLARPPVGCACGGQFEHAFGRAGALPAAYHGAQALPCLDAAEAPASVVPFFSGCFLEAWFSWARSAKKV